MQSTRFSSSSRALALSVAATALSALGCSGNPPAGSAAYQAGELGNGSFTFSCDDAVSCLSASNDAKAFPSGVALGSTFRVRYVPKESASLDLSIDDDDAPSGNNGTLTSVGDRFLVKSAGGFTARAAGHGTIVARNAAGALLEFTTIRISEPAQLVVYEATSTTTASVSTVRSLTIPLKGVRALRVVAQDSTHQNLGGSFPTAWTPRDETVARVDSREGGKITLLGDTAGTTELEIAGLGLTTKISVEVK